MQEQIDGEIQKLQSGHVVFLPGKGKGGNGKGAGKQKSEKGCKNSIPVDPAAFRHQPLQVRDGLATFTFSRFPFNISIRALDGRHSDERDVQRGQAPPRCAQSQEMMVDHEGLPATKRYADGPATEQQIKRRSPAPSRDGGATYQQQPQTGWAADPWAVAAAANNPAHSSSSSAHPPRRDEGSGDAQQRYGPEQAVAAGSRIAA